MELNSNDLIYKFVPGLRKNSNLLFVESENELYKLKDKSAKYDRYVCYQKECHVSVSIDVITKKCQKLNKKSHEHGSQEEFIKKLELINNIKLKCENVNLKRHATREVFDSECLNHPDSAHLVQYKKLKRSLCYIKNQVLPKKPKSALEIKQMLENESILEKFGTSKCIFSNETPAESQLFYKDTIIEKDFAYSVFMSPTISQTIRLSSNLERHFLMDATFNIVPESGYKQLLTIHIAHLNHVSKSKIYNKNISIYWASRPGPARRGAVRAAGRGEGVLLATAAAPRTRTI